MGHRSIVISIKRQGKVRSWEGDRNLCGRLIDPKLFEDLESAPSSTPFFSRKKRLDDLFLGELEQTRLVPGTSGWIGVDVDRRVVWDAQGYMDQVGTYVAKLGIFQGRPSLQDLPDPVLRALCLGRWSAQVVASSASHAWMEFPALGEVGSWAKEEELVTGKVERQARATVGPSLSLNQMEVEIRPCPPPGWKMVDALKPSEDPLPALAAFTRLMGLVTSSEWGWDDSLWPHWQEHAIRYHMLPGVEVNQVLDKLFANDLDLALPSSTPSRPSIRF